MCCSGDIVLVILSLTRSPTKGRNVCLYHRPVSKNAMTRRALGCNYNSHVYIHFGVDGLIALQIRNIARLAQGRAPQVPRLIWPGLTRTRSSDAAKTH